MTPSLNASSRVLFKTTAGGGDPDRHRERTQLPLDDADVLRAHAQQLLLRTVQPFQPGVHVLVADAFTGLLDADVAVHRRHRSNAAIARSTARSIGSWLPELVVRRLQQRLERLVQPSGGARVDRRGRFLRCAMKRS